MYGGRWLRGLWGWGNSSCEVEVGGHSENRTRVVCGVLLFFWMDKVKIGFASGGGDGMGMWGL